MAWWMPSSSRPGIGRVGGTLAAPASPMASQEGRNGFPGKALPPPEPPAEPGAFAPHLVEPPVPVTLLQLERWDAVAQQAAGGVVALEDGHRVPGPGELLRGGQPGRAGADHCA